MDVANQPTPPPGASLEGVGRGWCMRVLLSLTMRLRKKIIYFNNGFILVLLFNWSLSPPNRWHYISQAITVEPPLLYHLLQDRLFLVGCCVYPHQSAAVLGLGVIHFILFFHCPNCHPNIGTTSPYTLQPHAPSLQHPSYCYHQFLVGCCLFSLEIGH